MGGPSGTFPLVMRSRPSLRTMSTYPVRVFGDPVLKQRAKDVTDIDGQLARFVDTMVDTMYEASGIGLAAPQVGVQKRMFTFDVGEGPQVLINPEVAEATGEWTYEEGCLSIPGFHFEIVRPKVVTMTGVDLDGNEVVIEGDELLGRVFLHELDHLDGVLMLDRLDPDERKRALRELRDIDLREAGPSGSTTSVACDEHHGRPVDAAGPSWVLRHPEAASVRAAFEALLAAGSRRRRISWSPSPTGGAAAGALPSPARSSARPGRTVSRSRPPNGRARRSTPSAPPAPTGAWSSRSASCCRPRSSTRSRTVS